jgi:hypothetical protein
MVAPEGTVHVYVVAPVTEGHEYATFCPFAQGVVVPVMEAGTAGNPFTETERVTKAPQLLLNATLILVVP